LSNYTEEINKNTEISKNTELSESKLTNVEKLPNSHQNSGNQYKFANDDLLEQHYNKHVINQKEFGNITKNQYLQQAQNVTKNYNYSGVRSNGDTLFYNSTTNEFVITIPNEVIRTYFKPTEGLQYYLREVAK
jgi:pyocin large subunit-like protein